MPSSSPHFCPPSSSITALPLVIPQHPPEQQAQAHAHAQAQSNRKPAQHSTAGEPPVHVLPRSHWAPGWKPGVMSSALWPLDADAAAASQARMQPVQPPLGLPARFSYPIMQDPDSASAASGSLRFAVAANPPVPSSGSNRAPPLAGLAHDRLPSLSSFSSGAPPSSKVRGWGGQQSTARINKVAAKSAARGSIWGRLGSETPALTPASSDKTRQKRQVTMLRWA
ncbi:uncharacterized protein Triagg1_5686 [Trichoderma aggressivum f. europaeum]|uniref:Uncharacterized protein n=1 Tax=Trichoderma aggressivum f. europaeum TaxID=173218 RepID=A0AAE1ICX0_9HYPO|nr:hypothetical protein Triagg1_5686 [Trichoderma aggressivum f. europaeum]